MSDKRYLGNIITPTPTAPAGKYQDNAASGVWSVQEAFTYKKAGLWPTAGSVKPPQQVLYNAVGTYSFVAPEDVTSVSVVAVGGGGRAGGGLGWKNNIPVTPGASYTVSITHDRSGGATGISYFINTSTVAGYQGAYSNGGTFVGDGGGNGGSAAYPHGGGGAGGYSGNGGNGATSGTGGSGAGGGGGGGAGLFGEGGGGGGGVGLLGQGASGAGGNLSGSNAYGGGGGSGGTGGGNGGSLGGGYGGPYGGGTTKGFENAPAESGAVRIIYSTDGVTRAFPSTNTGNLT